MNSLLFVILVLLSTPLSKSAPNHETLETFVRKVSPTASYRSQIISVQRRRSKRNYNDSEPIETLFIPEDPSQYEDILLRVRKIFVQEEKSSTADDQEILQDLNKNISTADITKENEFSKIDHVQGKHSCSTEREGNEDKYLQRNPGERNSLRTTAEINGENEPVVKRNNYDTVQEGKLEPNDEDLLEAANFGLKAMKDLYTVKEPMLYSMGLYLDSDNPARHVAVFNDQSEEARTLAKYGFAILQSTTIFRRKFPGSSTDSLLSRRSQNNPLQRGCPNRGVPSCPVASLTYRTSDGSCNNLQHLWWGSAMSTMQRFLPPVYDDGIQSIRKSVTGRPLPSPRQVSTGIHEDQDIPLASVTHMLMQWGQFVDHDITATGQNRGFNGSIPQCCLRFGTNFQPPEFMHPECLPIAVSLQDSFLGRLGVRCLEFVRSGPAPREDCQFGPREQLSQVTSFLDASTVYSSNAQLSDSLRIFRNGLLQYGKLQSQRPQLPKLDFDLCRRGSLSTSCFRAGDGRVGEQPALTSLHVAFLRLHNRIATKLAALNPHWNDEKLFQESRRIVGAIVQHITYREFLPIVLGQDVMKIFDLTLLKKGYYEGYDPTVDPTIANAFSAAAYRFGHSLVQSSFVRFDGNHQPIFNNVSIHNEFTNPANLETAGSVDRLLLGLINQPAQRRDEHINEELTNHLFQTPNFPFGMDLASINIQRGRDHGIPPYVHWREPCGLPPIKNFNDLEKRIPRSTVRKFKSIYSSVEDIDLFSAGLAEKSVAGGLVGPTFACIIGQQFSNLRKGDRFWYENSGQESSFTPGQLQQIRRVSLAQVLCSTMDNIETVQPFVFLTHDTLKNQRLSCRDPIIGRLNLEFWAERQPEIKSRAGLLDKVLKRTTTPSPPAITRTTTSKQDNTGSNETPAQNRLNFFQNLIPPKASVHQINRIIVKKPIGPPDNYTIIVQNNAINSPVFVNDAIHGSNIKIEPSLNQQTPQKPVYQDHLAAPTPLPFPRPIPTTHPLEHLFAPRPYVPYSFSDPSNPNPLNQGFQPAQLHKDVVFESYPFSSPRPTLYTYYTSFHKQTTPRPPQDVDAYLVNYKPEYHGSRPGSSSHYQMDQSSRPNYSSSGNQQFHNDQGYTSKFEDESKYQTKPYRPTSDLQGQLQDSENRYRPGNEYTTWSSLHYDKTEPDVNNYHSTRPAYQNPIQTDLASQTIVPNLDENHHSDHTGNPVKHNTPHLSSSGKPLLNDDPVRNRNDYYSSTAHSSSVYKPIQTHYESHKYPYQSLARPEPSKIHSVTVMTRPTVSQGVQEIDKIENRVTSEIPRPLKSKISNNVARKPGQYYYEKNVLHRYPDKIEDLEEPRNVEERNKATNNDASIDQTLIDASVRKQQVISSNGSNTSKDITNQFKNESSDNLTGDDVDQNLDEAFSEVIEDVAWNNRTNQWLNPQEDASLESAIEVPKIPSDISTAANELPKPLKIKNCSS